MSGSSDKPRWRDGFWYNSKISDTILVVEGDNVEAKNLVALDFPDIDSGNPMTFKYGNFGPAKDEVAKATGETSNNFELGYHEMFKMCGVMNEEGTQLTVWGFANAVETFKWLTPEEVDKVKEERDDFDAPSCPYETPGAEKPGKVFWLSGAPGAGKSTTCQLLAKKNGYVYYEADSTMKLCNPFIDVNVDNPSLASVSAKPLKGVSQEDAKDILKFSQDSKKLPEMIQEGKFGEMEKLHRPVLRIISREVSKQKKRLGGDFAVAHAVSTRKNRELCREILGPDAVFVVLNLTRGCVKERLRARHGGALDGAIEEMLGKAFDMYEPVGEDEEGALNVTVTEDMTPDNVLQKVLEVIGPV